MFSPSSLPRVAVSRTLSSRSLSSRLVGSCLVAVVVVGLAGCGRKDAPELPVTGPAKTESRPLGIPMGPTAAPQKPAEPKEKKTFILDFLL